MRVFLLAALPLVSPEGLFFEMVSVKDIFLAALERACLANVSLVRNSSFSEICPVGVIVSPASMPVAPSLISRNSSSIFPDTEPLKLQACLSVQGQRSNENEPTGQVSDVILAQRDSTTGQLRLPLVLTHPFVSRSSVLPSEVRVELCIAVLRVTPPSEASLAEQPPEFWPSTTNAITWCGAPASSESSVAEILVPEPGRYLAAAMLVTVQPVNHANVLPAEETSWDGICGPLHLLDLHVLDPISRAGSSYNKRLFDDGIPGSSNMAKWTFAPPIAFVLGGFPKTGTSTLWGNLGYRSPGVGLSASQDIRFNRVSSDVTERATLEDVSSQNDEVPAAADPARNCSLNGLKRKPEVAMYPTEPGTLQEIEEWRRRVLVDFREVLQNNCHCQPPHASSTSSDDSVGNDKDNDECSRSCTDPNAVCSNAYGATTEEEYLMLGFKATNFMIDLRWARALQNQNPSVKFVVSLRKPSAWLRSFVRYRQTEAQGRAPWLVAALDAHPELLSITFADVALGGVDLFGADRKRGHFDRWLEPLVDFLYETGRSVKDALMVVFLEHMAADPLGAHTAVARFLDLNPKVHLPQHLHIVNGAHTVPAFVASTNANASTSAQSTDSDSAGAEGSVNTTSSSTEAERISRQKEKESGSWWCLGITEADGPFDPSNGCRWVSDEPIIRVLDDFYKPSMQRLNDVLRVHLDTPNPWWGI